MKRYHKSFIGLLEQCDDGELCKYKEVEEFLDCAMKLDKSNQECIESLWNYLKESHNDFDNVLKLLDKNIYLLSLSVTLNFTLIFYIIWTFLK